MLRFCTVTASFLLAFACHAEKADRPASQAEAEAENRTAVQTLRDCTALIPTERLLLKGDLTVRKRRGIVLQKEAFHLLMDWGARVPSAEVLLLDTAGTSLVERAILTRPAGQPATIQIYKGANQTPDPNPPSLSARVRGTDLTWLDLSLDFLWWPGARFDDEPRSKSHNGRDCDVIVTVPPAPIPGCAAVRVWVDRQLRCIMQAEQIGPQGETVRRMWVQRVKKMDDRWMIRDMEIETLNSGHRTKLFVDHVSSP